MDAKTLPQHPTIGYVDGFFKKTMTVRGVKGVQSRQVPSKGGRLDPDLRLRRLMCGKALPFRRVSFKSSRG